MSLTVAENESGLCYNSKIRYLEKSEVTKRKTISCPDIEDYKTASQEPDVVWYKVTIAVLLLLGWNSSKLSLFAVWGLELTISEASVVCDRSGECFPSMTVLQVKLPSIVIVQQKSVSVRMFWGCSQDFSSAVPHSQTTVPLYLFVPGCGVPLHNTGVETKGGTCNGAKGVSAPPAPSVLPINFYGVCQLISPRLVNFYQCLLQSAQKSAQVHWVIVMKSVHLNWGQLETFNSFQVTHLPPPSPRTVKYHTPLSSADVLVMSFSSSPRKQENE